MLNSNFFNRCSSGSLTSNNYFCLENCSSIYLGIEIDLNRDKRTTIDELIISPDGRLNVKSQEYAETTYSHPRKTHIDLFILTLSY